VARRQVFSVDQLLDGAQRAVALHGREVTLQQISEQCGAPMGSIYYRFASRDELLGELWLRAIGRWHQYLVRLIDDTPEPRAALLAVASAIPEYCRRFPDEAMAMTLWRQPDLATAGPVSLRARAAVVNDHIYTRIMALAGEVVPGAEFEQVVVVVMQLSYGLVRPLVGQAVPQWLDPVVVAAVDGALDVLKAGTKPGLPPVGTNRASVGGQGQGS